MKTKTVTKKDISPLQSPFPKSLFYRQKVEGRATVEKRQIPFSRPKLSSSPKKCKFKCLVDKQTNHICYKRLMRHYLKHKKSLSDA